MAGEDRAYTRWIRMLECAAATSASTPCEGRVEVHHAGRRGLSQRAHDSTAIPLCTYHHRCWHDHSGWCQHWDRERRRRWVAHWIAKLTSTFEDHLETPWQNP